MSKIALVLAMLLFILMLCIPIQAQAFKLMLILSLLFIVMIKSKIVLPRNNIFYWISIFVIANIGFLSLGVFNGFSSTAFLLFKVYLIWPLLYLFFIPFISNERSVHALEKCFLFSAYFIGIAYVLFFIFPESPIFELLNIQAGIGKSLAFYAPSPCLTSMIFIGPFFISSLYIFTVNNSSLLKSKTLVLANVLCLFVAAISGRRMLQLVFLLAPFFHLFFVLFLNQSERHKHKRAFVYTLGAMLAAILLFVVSFPKVSLELFNNFIEGFAFSGGSGVVDPGAAIRKQQFVKLISAWLQEPLFGHGAGAYLSDFIRNEANKGTYELTYVAMLFQTGIVGITIYVALVAWMYIKSTKIISTNSAAANHLIPIMVGFTCVLIGNGTNPYLYSFDYIWVLFLPLLFINMHTQKRIREVYL